jgi:hypothetical protein
VLPHPVESRKDRARKGAAGADGLASLR